MQTTSDLFETKLRKRLTEVIAELKDQLSATVVSELSRPNYIIGQIAAYEAVFGLCNEVQSEINER